MKKRHGRATQNHKSNRESLKHEWDEIFLCLPNISISCGGLLGATVLSQRKTPNILLIFSFSFTRWTMQAICVCLEGWTRLMFPWECVIMSYNYSGLHSASISTNNSSAAWESDRQFNSSSQWRMRARRVGLGAPSWAAGNLEIRKYFDGV